MVGIPYTYLSDHGQTNVEFRGCVHHVTSDPNKWEDLGKRHGRPKKAKLVLSR